MVLYAVVAGLVSVGALSAFSVYDVEITDMVVGAADAARGLLNGRG